MAHWEQFELWRLSGDKWELIASFRDFEVANAVARNHTSRVRLVHAVYDNGAAVEKEVLFEVGKIRNQP